MIILDVLVDSKIPYNDDNNTYCYYYYNKSTSEYEINQNTSSTFCSAKYWNFLPSTSSMSLSINTLFFFTGTLFTVTGAKSDLFIMIA